MTALDWAVVLLSGALLAFLAWYFFGPRASRPAELHEGVQEAEIVVRGGYSPEAVRVRQGIPLRLVFDRRESGECTSRVVFPDFGVSRSLPAFARSVVELDPRQAGEYRFSCGENMVHGRLIVEPDDSRRSPTPPQPSEAPSRVPEPAPPPGHGPQDTEAAERRAEIRDLSRRVLVGAVLTLPVAFAVMAHEIFGATWLPEPLLNRWTQLALITPVMFYTGWPIHTVGWLALRHRSAEIDMPRIFRTPE